MSIEVSIIISAVSVLIAVLSYFRGGKKESADSAATLARIEVKLDSISRRVDDTCEELIKHREELGKHSERLVSVEASAKQSHKRLDTLEARIAALEGLTK